MDVETEINRISSIFNLTAEINSVTIFALLPINGIFLAITMYNMERVGDTYFVLFDFIALPSVFSCYRLTHFSLNWIRYWNLSFSVGIRYSCSLIQYIVFDLLVMANFVLLLCIFYYCTDRVDRQWCILFELVWVPTNIAEILYSDYRTITR